MPLSKKEKNRRYQQSHKPELARKMRIYRAKKKYKKETEEAEMTPKLKGMYVGFGVWLILVGAGVYMMLVGILDIWLPNIWVMVGGTYAEILIIQDLRNPEGILDT